MKRTGGDGEVYSVVGDNDLIIADVTLRQPGGDKGRYGVGGH